MISVVDALLGLRELLGKHPEIINANLTHVLRASTRLLMDEVGDETSVLSVC